MSEADDRAAMNMLYGWREAELESRAEQAEALVGRWQRVMQEEHTRDHPNGCDVCQLLDDPTGARLAEEQRALDMCFRLLKTTAWSNAGTDWDAVRDAVAAVERARAGRV